MDTYGISTRLLNATFHRGAYLPHCNAPGAIQFVTFRLADSVPEPLIRAWREELSALVDEERHHELHRRVEAELDRLRGERLLENPRHARQVEAVLRHFDRKRYDIYAFVIMPNHVHVVFRLRPGRLIESIVRPWKSISGTRIHRDLGRTGSLWARDYWDRVVRDDEHLARVITYVEWNPVRAGLCREPEEWEFSSARWSRHSGDTGPHAQPDARPSASP